MKKVYVGIFSLALLFSGCTSSGNPSTEDEKVSALNESEFINLGDVVDSYGSPRSILSNSNILSGVQSMTESSSSSLSSLTRVVSSLNVEKSSKSVQAETLSFISSAKRVILQRDNNPRGLKQLLENNLKMEGSVSGYADLQSKIDIETGTVSGKVTFVNFLDDMGEIVESDTCLNSEDIEPFQNKAMNGYMEFSMGQFNDDFEPTEATFNGKMKIDNSTIKFNVSGIFENSEAEISISGDLIVGKLTLKDGAVILLKGLNEDEVKTVVNAEISTENETIKFIDYTTVEIDNWEEDEISTYPVSGDIAVSNSDINGYFSIDESYNHKATPVVINFSEDSCTPKVLSGEEHYIGENSSLVWRVESLNNCFIDLDRDGDGEIDETIEDSCQNY